MPGRKSPPTVELAEVVQQRVYECRVTAGAGVDHRPGACWATSSS